MAAIAIPYLHFKRDIYGNLMDKQKVIEYLQLAIAELQKTDVADTDIQIAWGAKVSPVFKDRILWTANEIEVDPNYLMACIAFESAETFSASIKNAAGSGATGLIQFMPKTAKDLGTSVTALAKMTPEDQIKYVYRYFLPYKGRLKTLEDVYMAILWPRAIGKPATFPLFTGGVAYRQNAGLDTNKDGIVTKYEAAKKVREKFERGMNFRG